MTEDLRYSESQVRTLVATALQKGFNIRNQYSSLNESTITTLTNEILSTSVSNNYTNDSFKPLHYDNFLIFGYIRQFQTHHSMPSIPKDIYTEILSIYPPLKKYLKPLNKIYKLHSNNKFINKTNLFANGKSLIEQNNLQDAILSFEANIQQNISNNFEISESWRYLGIAQSENENEKDALAAYLKCYSLNPYNLDVLLTLSVSYCNELDTNNALNCMKQWIANNCKYFGLISDDNESDTKQTVSGFDYDFGSSSDKHQQIVDLYLCALDINEMDADLQFVLGVLYNLTSQYDIAEDYFRNAIKMRPNDASLWNKLGATQANGNKPNEAIKSYKRALELKPNYVRTLSNLGISYANQKMHKEACEAYLKSLKLNPNADDVWSHLKMSLMYLGRTD
eukprot:13452_1